MEKLRKCVVDSGQHFWVALPEDGGLPCYSCPMCGQLIYWSETLLQWIKPGTSGGKEIKGNNPTNDKEET